jgi:TPP-dependent pyruvate/acetoin dehydrogenase alpha subunit
VDGNDVDAVYHASAEAVALARAGGGPTLIEAVTMRMRGHSIIDGAEYVPPAQLEAWAKRDPIAAYRAVLTADGIWDEDQEAAQAARIEETVEAAIALAESMPDPVAADAAAGVFAVAGDGAPRPGGAAVAP